MVVGFDMYVLQGYTAYSWYFVLEVRMTLRPQRLQRESGFQISIQSIVLAYCL
jgi:hypothetical protein